MADEKLRRPRVAVIGSGLAGLTTAYLLRQEGCEVWLIEKSPRVGFHSSSVDIVSDKKTGQSAWTVDVPMRSFQGGYYPLLISLYKHLKLPLEQKNYTFSFSRLPTYPQTPKPSSETYFIHSGASGLSLPSIPSSTTSLSSLLWSIGRIIAYAGCYLLLLVLGLISWHGLLPNWTFHEFVKVVASHLDQPIPTLPLPITRLGAIWKSFAGDILIPLFGAVGTMTTDDILDTPVGPLLEYVHSTVGTWHYTLGDGSGARDVAEGLVKCVRGQGEGYVKLGEEVVGMSLESAGKEVRLEMRGGEGVVVDRVVFATQASAAERLLGMAEESLRGSAAVEGELKRINRMTKGVRGVEYRKTIVVTHRDTSILPSPADQREINLLTPQLPEMSTRKSRSSDRGIYDLDNTPPLSPDRSSSASVDSTRPQTPNDHHFPPRIGSIYTMGNHVMHPPRGLHYNGKRVEAIIQSTNPVLEIEEDSILAVAKLERALPLRDPSRTLADLHPSHSSSSSPIFLLAGAYAHPGIPLLEGCIGSARRAVSTILDTPQDQLGKVDWQAGRGSLPGRIWRWRRRQSWE